MKVGPARMTLFTGFVLQVEDKFSPFAKDILAKLIKFQRVCGGAVNSMSHVVYLPVRRKRSGQPCGSRMLRFQKTRSGGRSSFLSLKT